MLVNSSSLQLPVRTAAAPSALIAGGSWRAVPMPARPAGALVCSFLSGNHGPNRARVHAHPGARFSNGLETVGIVWTGGSFSIDAETRIGWHCI
jgi:hypothetical protein